MIFLICLALMVPQIYAGAINAEISNGALAKLGQFPYQAFIYSHHTSGGQSICGGSLLEGGYILTAAHCFLKCKTFDVYLGIVDFTDEDQIDKAYVESNLPLSSAMIHETYDDSTKKDDIALIKLKHVLKDGDHPNVATMPLPDPSWAAPNKFDNYNATLAGFGKTSQESSPSQQLRYAHMHMMPHQECLDFFKDDLPITNQICTDKKIFNTGACQGDSGGPLTVEVDGKQRQIGLTSFHLGDCAKNPNVFTNVAYYVDWIHKHMSS